MKQIELEPVEVETPNLNPFPQHKTKTKQQARFFEGSRYTHIHFWMYTESILNIEPCIHATMGFDTNKTVTNPIKHHILQFQNKHTHSKTEYRVLRERPPT